MCCFVSWNTHWALGQESVFYVTYLMCELRQVTKRTLCGFRFSRNSIKWRKWAPWLWPLFELSHAESQTHCHVAIPICQLQLRLNSGGLRASSKRLERGRDKLQSQRLHLSLPLLSMKTWLRCWVSACHFILSRLHDGAFYTLLRSNRPLLTTEIEDLFACPTCWANKSLFKVLNFFFSC